MKKKILLISIACLLLFTMTACGYGANQARDVRDTRGVDLSNYSNRMDRMDQSPSTTSTYEQPMAFGQISSEKTDTPSEQYPHTRAIQVQHAKYAFISVDEQGKQQTIQLPENVTKSLPGNVQNLTPEQIARFLPKDISQILPDGNEHLTPETIARLIKEGAGGQQPGAQPAPGAHPTPGMETPTRDTEQAPTPATPEAIPTPQPEAPQQTEQPEQRAETPSPTPRAEGLSEMEAKVVELTNQERRKAGLSDLQADTSLSNVAREKSNDMQANNYFSHTSPTYGSPFDMMRDFGVSYNAAAENIAQGQRSAEEVVRAWMNSEGHRKNIMNGNFTHIGVGHNTNGNYWTQMFISR